MWGGGERAGGNRFRNKFMANSKLILYHVTKFSLNLLLLFIVSKILIHPPQTVPLMNKSLLLYKH